jgi:hypothetical protein
LSLKGALNRQKEAHEKVMNARVSSLVRQHEREMALVKEDHERECERMELDLELTNKKVLRQKNFICVLETKLDHVGEENMLMKGVADDMKQDLSEVKCQARKGRSNLQRDKKKLEEAVDKTRKDFEASFVVGLDIGAPHPPPLHLFQPAQEMATPSPARKFSKGDQVRVMNGAVVKGKKTEEHEAFFEKFEGDMVLVRRILGRKTLVHVPIGSVYESISGANSTKMTGRRFKLEDLPPSAQKKDRGNSGECSEGNCHVFTEGNIVAEGRTE